MGRPINDPVDEIPLRAIGGDGDNDHDQYNDDEGPANDGDNGDAGEPAPDGDA
ncbi:MAG: hypothetical protein UW53_C0025G0006 [Candidatus Giovannonibacteria bacterium GW2011_GWA1_44_25]|uniref:Uncharacterized protein n=1 Tax=Candidatus Giovannonibacteria bacterium GW2011_GWA1_44_25 TaxID=1618645 RepID=A0A0G1IIJ9_9BACT|nr:MAG: hypothetical protein UW53_C0025G0006 [Candidatus Giovannonibacteria bacterium GW2011_GWA1_44_25]